MKSKMFDNTNRELILTSAGFGPDVAVIKMGCCATCGNSIQEDEFKDQLSIKEFHISGLCQKCQDSIFGVI